MKSLKGIRFVLGFALLITLYFAFVMLFQPQTLMEIYGATQFDALHHYFARVNGVTLVVFCIGMSLAFIMPRKFSGIILMIILYHFALFSVDLVLIAQKVVSAQYLVPEMVYFVVICAGMIRYFPTKIAIKKEGIESIEPEIVDAVIIESPEPSESNETD